MPPTQDTNVLATISFVLVVLFGVLAVPVAIPMGLVARAQIRRSAASGAAMANAALVIGAIYVVIGITAIALWFVIPGGSSVGAGAR
jgi:hypothetical protein